MVNGVWPWTKTILNFVIIISSFRTALFYSINIFIVWMNYISCYLLILLSTDICVYCAQETFPSWYYNESKSQYLYIFYLYDINASWINHFNYHSSQCIIKSIASPQERHTCMLCHVSFLIPDMTYVLPIQLPYSINIAFWHTLLIYIDYISCPVSF